MPQGSVCGLISRVWLEPFVQLQIMLKAYPEQEKEGPRDCHFIILAPLESRFCFHTV